MDQGWPNGEILASYAAALAGRAVMSITDDQGRILHATNAFCTMTGYRLDELIGKDHRILHSGYHEPSFFADIWSCLANGETWRGEICNRTKDGCLYWVDATIVPVLDDGRPPEKGAGAMRYVSIHHDISERKSAKEILREALESIPEGFVVYDPQDRLLECNSAYRHFYRASSAALKVGTSFEEILRYGLANGQYPEASDDETEREAWIADRMGRHYNPQGESIVQQLDDGRFVQIRERVTPSGYIVGFRTDITEVKRQAATLQAAFENFPGGIAYFCENLVLRSANSKYRDFMQYPEGLVEHGEVQLADIFRYNAERGEYGPGLVEELVARRIAFVCRPYPHVYEHERPDGLVMEVRSTPVPGGGYVFSHMDVTIRKEIEKALIGSERRAREKSAELEVVLAHMNQGVSVFDAEGRLTHFNERYEEVFAKAPGEAKVGMTLLELIRLESERGDFAGDPEAHVADLHARLAQGETVRCRFELASGRVVSSVHAPMPGGGWVGTHEDVTERERAAAKIVHAANHDMLTGLANRALFTRTVDDALRRIAATGGGLCVAIVDLDHFKSVNDTHGHAVGDEVLRQVSERMRRCVRPDDLVARIGGDEFALLIEGSTNLRETAALIAARLVETLGAPYIIDGFAVDIGASIGLAVGPEQGNTPDILQRNADSALYKVKADGRNGFRFHEDAASRLGAAAG
ncbi:PAS-domain containing protein [Stappia sp. F7233]|uniref:PAS-domain containing protein n=1 Tax=Stappia albiluteola TaxID=2758565 RepID=A0A839AL78_9HYPH|nr:PAS-domain containing protein [Stappia albiluteola]MBA5779199.1 PAS-domain containing protein [Stappia albiluteola]